MLQGVKNVFWRLALNLSYFENSGDNLQSLRQTQITVQAGDALVRRQGQTDGMSESKANVLENNRWQVLLGDDKADREGRREILASTCSLATQSYQTDCLPKTGWFGFFKKKQTNKNMLLPEAWFSRKAWLMCI